MAHPNKNKRPPSMRGNAQERRSARYFKTNKAGDAGGQKSRPNVNDDEIIFTDPHDDCKLLNDKEKKVDANIRINS